MKQTLLRSFLTMLLALFVMNIAAQAQVQPGSTQPIQAWVTLDLNGNGQIDAIVGVNGSAQTIAQDANFLLPGSASNYDGFNVAGYQFNPNPTLPNYQHGPFASLAQNCNLNGTGGINGHADLRPTRNWDDTNFDGLDDDVDYASNEYDADNEYDPNFCGVPGDPLGWKLNQPLVVDFEFAYNRYAKELASYVLLPNGDPVFNFGDGLCDSTSGRGCLEGDGDQDIILFLIERPANMADGDALPQVTYDQATGVVGFGRLADSTNGARLSQIATTSLAEHDGVFTLLKDACTVDSDGDGKIDGVKLTMTGGAAPLAGSLQDGFFDATPVVNGAPNDIPGVDPMGRAAPVYGYEADIDYDAYFPNGPNTVADQGVHPDAYDGNGLILNMPEEYDNRNVHTFTGGSGADNMITLTINEVYSSPWTGEDLWIAYRSSFFQNNGQMGDLVDANGLPVRNDFHPVYLYEDLDQDGKVDGEEDDNDSGYFDYTDDDELGIVEDGIETPGGGTRGDGDTSEDDDRGTKWQMGGVERFVNFDVDENLNEYDDDQFTTGPIIPSALGEPYYYRAPWDASLAGDNMWDPCVEEDGLPCDVAGFAYIRGGGPAVFSGPVTVSNIYGDGDDDFVSFGNIFNERTERAIQLWRQPFYVRDCVDPYIMAVEIQDNYFRHGAHGDVEKATYPTVLLGESDDFEWGADTEPTNGDQDGLNSNDRGGDRYKEPPTVERIDEDNVAQLLDGEVVEPISLINFDGNPISDPQGDGYIDRIVFTFSERIHEELCPEDFYDAFKLDLGYELDETEFVSVGYGTITNGLFTGPAPHYKPYGPAPESPGFLPYVDELNGFVDPTLVAAPTDVIQYTQVGLTIKAGDHGFDTDVTPFLLYEAGTGAVTDYAGNELGIGANDEAYVDGDNLVFPSDDDASPVMTEICAIDSNKDGYIDAIDVAFTEPLAFIDLDYTNDTVDHDANADTPDIPVLVSGEFIDRNFSLFFSERDERYTGLGNWPLGYAISGFQLAGIQADTDGGYAYNLKTYRGHGAYGPDGTTDARLGDNQGPTTVRVFLDDPYEYTTEYTPQLEYIRGSNGNTPADSNDDIASESNDLGDLVGDLEDGNGTLLSIGSKNEVSPFDQATALDTQYFQQILPQLFLEQWFFPTYGVLRTCDATDKAAPVVMFAGTQDAGHRDKDGGAAPWNGYIDGYKLVFSEPVKDATFGEYGTETASFSVTGEGFYNNIGMIMPGTRAPYGQAFVNFRRFPEWAPHDAPEYDKDNIYIDRSDDNIIYISFDEVQPEANSKDGEDWDTDFVPELAPGDMTKSFNTLSEDNVWGGGVPNRPETGGEIITMLMGDALQISGTFTNVLGLCERVTLHVGGANTPASADNYVTDLNFEWIQQGAYNLEDLVSLSEIPGDALELWKEQGLFVVVWTDVYPSVGGDGDPASDTYWTQGNLRTQLGGNGGTDWKGNPMCPVGTVLNGENGADVIDGITPTNSLTENFYDGTMPYENNADGANDADANNNGAFDEHYWDSANPVLVKAEGEVGYPRINLTYSEPVCVADTNFGPNKDLATKAFNGGLIINPAMVLRDGLAQNMTQASGKDTNEKHNPGLVNDVNDDAITYTIATNGNVTWYANTSPADHYSYTYKCGSFFINSTLDRTSPITPSGTIEHGEGDGAAGGNLVDNGDDAYYQDYPTQDIAGIMYQNDVDGNNASASYIAHPYIPGSGPATPRFDRSQILTDRILDADDVAADWLKLTELGPIHDYAPEPQAAMPPAHFFDRDDVSQESGIPLHLKFIDDANSVGYNRDGIFSIFTGGTAQDQLINDEECEDGDPYSEVDDADPYENFYDGVIANIGNSHAGGSWIDGNDDAFLMGSNPGFDGWIPTTDDWRVPVRQGGDDRGEIIAYQGNAMVFLDCAAQMHFEDETAPQLCSAWTYDWDADGQIDRVILQFTETVDVPVYSNNWQTVTLSGANIDVSAMNFTETNDIATVFEDTDWTDHTYNGVKVVDPTTDDFGPDYYFWGLEGGGTKDDLDSHGYAVNAKGEVRPTGSNVPFGLVDRIGDGFVVIEIEEVSDANGYNGGDTDVTPDVNIAATGVADLSGNAVAGPDENTWDFNGEEMFDCAAPAIMGLLNANDDVTENDVEGRSKVIGPSTVEVRFSEPIVWSTLIQGRQDPLDQVGGYGDSNPYYELEDEDFGNTFPNAEQDGYRIIDLAFDMGTLDSKTDLQSNDIADLHALVSGSHVGLSGCVGGVLDDPDELVVVDPASYGGCYIHAVRVFFTANDLFTTNSSPQVDTYFKDMGFVSDKNGIFNNQHGNAAGAEANFRHPVSNRFFDKMGEPGPDTNNENTDVVYGVWTQDWWGDSDDYLGIPTYGTTGTFVERGVRLTDAQGVASIAGAADGCSSVIDVPDTNGSILDASVCRSDNDPFSDHFVDGSTQVTEYQIFRKNIATGAYTLVARLGPPSQDSDPNAFGVTFPLLPVSNEEFEYFVVAVGGGTSGKEGEAKAEFDATEAVREGDIATTGKDLKLTNKVGQTYASEAVFIGSVTATDPFPPENLSDPKIYDGNTGNTLVGTFPTPSEHGQVDLYQFPGLLSLPGGVVMIPKISAYKIYDAETDQLITTVPSTNVTVQAGRVRVSFESTKPAGEPGSYYMTATDGINETEPTDAFTATTYGGSGIVGDGNADGCIDVVDLTLLGNVYNSQLGDINYTTAYDFNTDTRINLIDFTLFGDSFGQGCGAGKLAVSDKALEPSGAQLAIEFDGSFVTVYGVGLEAEGVQFTFTAEGADFVSVQQGNAFSNGLAVHKQGESGEVTFAAASMNGKVSDGVIAVFELSDNATEVNLNNIAIVRTSDTGSLSKLGAEAVKAIGIPEEFALEQNYPNPFNPTTNISFSLPETNDVKLEIYDLTGRLIRSLVSGQVQAGVHTLQWDGLDASGAQVASGVYLYRIQSGAFTQTNKMTLLK